MSLHCCTCLSPLLMLNFLIKLHWPNNQCFNHLKIYITNYHPLWIVVLSAYKRLFHFCNLFLSKDARRSKPRLCKTRALYSDVSLSALSPYFFELASFELSTRAPRTRNVHAVSCCLFADAASVRIRLQKVCFIIYCFSKKNEERNLKHEKLLQWMRHSSFASSISWGYTVCHIFMSWHNDTL